MVKINISLAQLELKFGDVNSNFAHAAEYVSKASERSCDLVLLPELWASGYDLENCRKYAVPINEGIFSQVSELSRDHKIAIGCSLLELSDGKVFNTFVLYGTDGKLWASYRKIHRFRLLHEEKWLEAGDELVLAQTPWGMVGMATCYDLRFPEMFRLYAVAGAQLIIIVAEWPERRILHWSKLLQARAIENQLFLAGVNKVGESQGVKLGGKSAIVDPWGVPIVEGNDGELLLNANIELGESDKVRRHIPVLEDRRPEIYLEGEKIIDSLLRNIDDKD